MKILRVMVAVTGLGGSLLSVWSDQSQQAGPLAPASSPEKRETVLDRRVHIEPVLQEVPRVPPWCDELKLDKRRVQVGDCELYCEIEGGGWPLVLINGGPGGTHHGFHPYFGRAAGFAKVVYYDQRGCGQSDYQRGSGYTLRQAVNDLEKLREALKLERWVVLGWSYGGVLAQCYALKFPERVRGLVLVGSGEDGMRLELEPTRQFAVWTAEEERRIAEIYADRSLPLAQMLYNKDINGDWKRQNYYKPTPKEFARGALYGCKYDPAFRRAVEQDLQWLYLRGMFEGCPVPILLLEGKHDLTWGADKPAKFHECFPGSRLVEFEASAHAPFADEPEKFFAALGEFMSKLPVQPVEVARWKSQITARQESPEYLLLTSGSEPASMDKIAREYSATWLPRISDADALLILGFVMYDAQRYSEALKVFTRMEEVGDRGVALVWQGHMLDLLGRRAEAVAVYQKALTTHVETRHDQYGIVMNKEYVEQRIKTAFSPGRKPLAE